MKLLNLFKNNYHLAAICSLRGDCELFDYLDKAIEDITEINSKETKRKLSEAATMVNLLERTSQHGPPKNKEKSRFLENNIFEFKHNQLRILYFYDAGKLIVCTHHFTKKQQKTPKKEIKRAKKMHELYLLNKKNKNLKFVDNI